MTDKPLQKTGSQTPAEHVSSEGDVAAFVGKARAMAAARGAQGRHGRLIFALDATMSRQPTWDSACQLQADMFREAGRIGGLDVQLVYFRGFGECRASRWVEDTEGLANLMTRIDVRGGQTQIRKVLAHARKEAENAKVDALVCIGDAMEESVDELCAHAGALGMLGVPVFLFQEGRNPIAERAFREIARLSGGAHSSFDTGSARQLRELLSAVAVYATGGHKALSDYSRGQGGEARKLLAQLKR